MHLFDLPAVFAGIDWAGLRSMQAPQFTPPPPPTPAAEALDWELTSLVRDHAPPLVVEYPTTTAAPVVGSSGPATSGNAVGAGSGAHGSTGAVAQGTLGGLGGIGDVGVQAAVGDAVQAAAGAGPGRCEVDTARVGEDECAGEGAVVYERNTACGEDTGSESNDE